ncbi:MAG: tripartite tricarboxylate transporter TctB family protein [Pseudolabrys sp.]|nr:tripartite tricarboxylate transporter TctB family protein [Pseudolabrys sp.]
MGFLSHIKRDYYAGALMVLIGLIAANDGRGYSIGTLRQMGPGYFPIALGIILIFLGILIAATASTGGEAHEEAKALPHNEWRGWFCIIAGPVSFIILGKLTGLALATFACVFVSSLGDRHTTLRGGLILATCVTVFGVLVFHYLLKIPMPVFKFGLS